MSTRRQFMVALIAGLGLPLIGGCVYQPLYGANSYAPEGEGAVLAEIEVAEVDTRVGQQVRNHLIFLLQGGRPAPEPRYTVRLRVTEFTELYAANRNYGGTTAGTATVRVSYRVFDNVTRKQIANGRRYAEAFYDRTGQSFANERAERDAENRAAKDVAEQLRLALAADLSRPQ